MVDFSISIRNVQILFLFMISRISLSTQSELIWSGAITPTSAAIVVQIDAAGVFAIGTTFSSLINSPIYSRYLASDGISRIEIDNLTPDTQYYYGIQGHKSLFGKFRTFREGKMSFKMAFGSCAMHGVNPTVFREIADQDFLFFLHMGDMHYHDIAVNDEAVFASAYETIHSESNQILLFHATPVVYMWDDHDYGPNNSDGNAIGKPAARKTYQKYVPHYPLVAGSEDNNAGIYQAFTVGRVRFILTDLRSESNVATMPNYPGLNGSTIMSRAQMEWLEDELSHAADYGLVVWMTSKPFNGKDIEPGKGKEPNLWAEYHQDRRTISDFIAKYNVSNIIAISGDAHFLAIDDGRHSDFSTEGGWGFPIFQAAPLSRTGSVKGGPYSEGCYGWRAWSSSNYGTMEVIDNGEDQPLCIQWKGFQHDRGSLHESIAYSACTPFNKFGFPSDKTVVPMDICSIPLAPTAIVLLFSTLFAVFISIITVIVYVSRKPGKDKKERSPSYLCCQRCFAHARQQNLQVHTTHKSRMEEEVVVNKIQ